MKHLLTRYCALLVVTAVGGVLSGILWLLPNGLMAGAMTFCFSLGTIWLAEMERRKRGSVRRVHAVAVGLLSGLLAALPLLLLEMTRVAHGNSEMAAFRPSPLSTTYLIVAPVMYGIAFHWSYHSRFSSQSPLWSPLWRACALTALIRVGLEAAKAQSLPQFREIGQILAALIPMSLFFLVFIAPFPILWVLLTAKFDPAWKRMTQPGPAARLPVAPEAQEWR